jgi:hypothetical protein
MPVKKLWIVSKTPWSATPQSSQPNGDTSWMSLSKMNGSANYPDSEQVEVRLTENAGSVQRSGAISVLSNGKTLTVQIQQKVSTPSLTWDNFVCDTYEADWSELLAHDGTAVSVTVTSNTNWTVE